MMEDSSIELVEQGNIPEPLPTPEIIKIKRKSISPYLMIKKKENSKVTRRREILAKKWHKKQSARSQDKLCEEEGIKL